MSAPVAKFIFEANGLSVTFTDRSLSIPTSWLWNFGFSVEDVEQTSNVQNPQQDFPEDGIYNISLRAENADGNNTYIFPILVSTTPGLNIPIVTLVKQGLPIGIEMDEIFLAQAQKKWQLFLYRAVPNLLEEDIFNEAKWPFQANLLISKLIIYDKILADSAKAIVSMSAGGTTKGALKRMEMGPSSAEWYDSSDYWKSIMSAGGILDLIKSELCFYAGTLGIFLPGICIPVNRVMPFIVVKGKRSICSRRR